jgi:hypothetical protein
MWKKVLKSVNKVGGNVEEIKGVVAFTHFMKSYTQAIFSQKFKKVYIKPYFDLYPYPHP